MLKIETQDNKTELVLKALDQIMFNKRNDEVVYVYPYRQVQEDPTKCWRYGFILIRELFIQQLGHAVVIYKNPYTNLYAVITGANAHIQDPTTYPEVSHHRFPMASKTFEGEDGNPQTVAQFIYDWLFAESGTELR